MTRPLLGLIGALTLGLTTLISGSAFPGQSPAPSQSANPPTFKGAVELIAVDAQVLDRDGHPITGLDAGKFSVTIDGRRRRVVSAALVDANHPMSLVNRLPVGGGTTTPTPPPLSGRVIVLAVDCISFNAVASRGVIDAARSFIERLAPTDEVGLFAYPIGPKVDPTTDHVAVIRALDGISGQRSGGSISSFHLRVSEIIDFIASMASPSSGTNRNGRLLWQDLEDRECPGDAPGSPDESCVARLVTEIQGTALYYEGQGNVSLGMLRSLLSGMAAVPGRKTLVLLSGGMPASDTPGGRPDLGEMGTLVGKEAARADTSVYTLYVDQSYQDRYSAETRKADAQVVNLERESALLGRWLDQFSGAAGGAMLKVLVGNGESVFDRILTETSSYYLLGVEPAESDRDGRAHEIRLKVDQKSATVRARTWVVVPKRGAVDAAAGSVAIVPAPITPTIVPVPRPLPSAVQTLADAFGRQDYAAFETGLRQTPDLPNLIHAYRTSDSPWPNMPHQSALLALELALAGLLSDNGYARDESAKLLAEYQVLVRQSATADAFECTWYWTELTGLEGLTRPDTGMLFVGSALERCPDEPRLHLAHAVFADQQWLQGRSRIVNGRTVVGTPGAVEETELMRLYERAAGFPETAAEARIRAAWFFTRIGKPERGLEWLNGVTGQPEELPVRYLGDLVRGQTLRALGRVDDAEVAFRAALTAWPGAQSAQVALMTLVARRGDREEATSLAESIQTAAPQQVDPWWVYWLGDFRMYSSILARARELGR